VTLLIDVASTPLDTETGQRPVGPGHRVEARRRGRTTVTTKAIESIIGRVAVETPDVSAARLTGVRRWFGDASQQQASTHIEHEAGEVEVSLTIAVTYPAPIEAVVERLRERVTATVDEHLGMTVRRVDVTVSELRRPAPTSSAGRVR
jgi:uncharacterized alkaline shock family protein YloU